MTLPAFYPPQAKADVDTFAQLGVLAIASRLKRLSDRIMQEGARIYQHLDVPFEPRWFPVAYWLDQQTTPVSMTDIARHLGLTHPAINQVIKDMAQHNLLDEFNDPEDKRRRQVLLSEKGQQLWQQTQPALQLIEQALHTLLGEEEHQLLNTLAVLENRLSDKGFYNTAASLNQQVRIVSYLPAYRQAYYQLNADWISRYFTLEPADHAMLNDPEGYVLAKGGHILFAVKQAQVWGTCALIPHTHDTAEITKMAVAPQAQGQKMGQLLLQAVINLGRQLGMRQLWLETNSTLKTAIHIYEKAGFKHVPTDPNSLYQRADVRMILFL